jgi:hypothetical protein
MAKLMKRLGMGVKTTWIVGLGATAILEAALRKTRARS